MFQRKLVVQQWNLYVDPLENQKYFRWCLLSGLIQSPLRPAMVNFFTLMSFGSYPVCKQQPSTYSLNLQNARSHITEPRPVLALLKLMGAVKSSRSGSPTLSPGCKNRGFKQAEFWGKGKLKLQQNRCLFDWIMCS